MKKLLKRPEALLIALALLFFAGAVLTGYLFTPDSENKASVIYVSDKDKERLIENSEATTVLINLNTATTEELMQLEGVGEVIADAIIDYRKENGGFSSVDELLDIKGIGETKYNSIKPYVFVE